jgi:hypothetical protein
VGCAPYSTGRERLRYQSSMASAPAYASPMPSLHRLSRYRRRHGIHRRSINAAEAVARCAPFTVGSPAPSLGFCIPGTASLGLRTRRQSAVQAAARLPELNPHPTRPARTGFGPQIGRSLRATSIGFSATSRAFPLRVVLSHRVEAGVGSGSRGFWKD